MAVTNSPSGTVVVRRLLDGPHATRIEVVHAGPYTRFSDALLKAILNGKSIYPHVRFDGVHRCGHTRDGATCSRDRTCFTGVRLHIDAANKHVIYLIGQYVPDDDVWEAAWPD